MSVDIETRKPTGVEMPAAADSFLGDRAHSARRPRRCAPAWLPVMVILALHCPARVLADSPQLLQLRVTQHRLTNGWTFLFVERHKLPVVSFLTVAGAGSSQDGHGTTGLAHMFEHMAQAHSKTRSGAKGVSGSTRSPTPMSRATAFHFRPTRSSSGPTWSPGGS